jgi:hypothetical protein
MLKRTICGSAALLLLVGTGCASRHEEGVKSDYRTQWTMVAADVKTTTEAAGEVLREADLKDIQVNSTNVDGTATGLKANGAKVVVKAVKKDVGTQVQATVGSLGDPDLGAEIVKKIKARAER